MPEERPDLLDPVAVALDFEEDWSGRDLSPDAFVLEGASDLSELFDLPLATVELENGVGRLRGQGSNCPQKIQAHAQNEGVRLFRF